MARTRANYIVETRIATFSKRASIHPSIQHPCIRATSIFVIITTTNKRIRGVPPADNIRTIPADRCCGLGIAWLPKKTHRGV